MTWGLPIGIFSVVLEFAVVGLFIDIIVSGFFWGLSLTLSTTMSVVDCISDGARRVEAMAGGSRIIFSWSFLYAAELSVLLSSLLLMLLSASSS